MGPTKKGEPAVFLAKALTYRGTSCTLWPFAVDGCGYPKMRSLDGKTIAIHRRVCTVKHGPPPPGHETAHSCGTRRCITPSHVSWKTHKENCADTSLMGRTTRGMKNSRAKLTDADVVHIRTMAGTMLQREIAALFNVTSAFVSQIIRYKRRA